MNQPEHDLQCACVRWFLFQHNGLAPLLFAVPNGGARGKATAGKLKAEGVVPGVADLLLLVANGQHHGLAIEMKTEKGRQSPEQKAWQAAIETQGFRYEVCRSLEGFIGTVDQYLKESGESPRPVGSPTN